MDPFFAKFKEIPAEISLLVSAYLRQTLLHQSLCTVPELLIVVCAAYYHIPEEWDVDWCEDGIEIDGKTAIRKTGSMDHRSVSMTKIVANGVHEWKFKMTNMSEAWQIIGVWRCNTSRMFDEDTIATDGYGYVVNYGCTTCATHPGQPGHLYGVSMKDGDELQMCLDLNKFTLSYKVNGTDYGVAFDNIQAGKYKAAVTMHSRCGKGEATATFISYRHVVCL